MDSRELGLVSIIILWLAFAVLLTKWRGNRSMSLSMHGASARLAYFLFASILIVHGLLFQSFMFNWFVPKFDLNLPFIIILYLTVFCLYATALIPDSHGSLRKLHRIVAFTMAFLIFVLTLFITIFASISLMHVLLGAVIVGYMVYCMLGLIKLRKAHMKKHFLPYQAVYIALFHIFILGITYL